MNQEFNGCMTGDFESFKQYFSHISSSQDDRLAITKGCMQQKPVYGRKDPPPPPPMTSLGYETADPRTLMKKT